MMKNSFKDLETAQMGLFTQQKDQRVFAKVSGNVNALRFLSNIVEMYIPMASSTLMSLAGDTSTHLKANDSSNYSANDENQATKSKFSSLGPSVDDIDPIR